MARLVRITHRTQRPQVIAQGGVGIGTAANNQARIDFSRIACEYHKSDRHTYVVHLTPEEIYRAFMQVPVLYFSEKLTPEEYGPMMKTLKKAFDTEA